MQTIWDKIEVSREGTKIQAKGETEKVQNSTKSFLLFHTELSGIQVATLTSVMCLFTALSSQ